MSGHTPGPWQVSGSDPHRILDNTGGWSVALSVINFDEGEANARLIAAAPDLLKENTFLKNKLRTGTLGGEGSHWVGCEEVHIDCARKVTGRLRTEIKELGTRSENQQKTLAYWGLILGYERGHQINEMCYRALGDRRAREAPLESKLAFVKAFLDELAETSEKPPGFLRQTVAMLCRRMSATLAATPADIVEPCEESAEKDGDPR